MADGARSRLKIEAVNRLALVPRDDWDAVANPPGAPYDPFLAWDFLEALESSGCADGRNGWQPTHLLARDEAGALVAAMPLYLKGHSYGEYVFDHAWADALRRAGGRYYPKLQCAVPFTPVTGRRFLAATADPVARQALEGALVSSAIALAGETFASSFHATFLPEDEWRRAGAGGLLQRVGVQYHWFNQGYGGFDDFLAALSSSKRKNIRKERERAKDGLRIRRLQGREISEADWDFFFRCYMDTGSRKWGQPYLNRAFFRLLGERMGERCVLFVADAGGAPIASALNLLGSEAIYGRYWGRVAEAPFLHFELCYYQAIDFAIEHGLPRVEAGAQGEHKLLRGYAPVSTYSAHWIAHQGLRQAVKSYLDSERPAVIEEIEQLAEHTPFKKLDAGGGG